MKNFTNFFNMSECLKIHVLNITKKRTKKGYKGLEKRIKTDAKKKKKKRRYGHEQYRNILEDEKQRLVEYRNKYYKNVS